RIQVETSGQFPRQPLDDYFVLRNVRKKDIELKRGAHAKPNEPKIEFCSSGFVLDQFCKAEPGLKKAINAS
ncbi:MAG: hypothetical protein AAF585_18500, partial [Verrucomicrobiota bacterium]